MSAVRLTTARVVSDADAAVEHLLSSLRSRQLEDGGWGASTGTPANTESTALAVLALAGAGSPVDEARFGAAVRWLLDSQAPDGAWRYDTSAAQATWPTPIALLALTQRKEASDAVERGFEWLLSIRGRSFPWTLRLREFITGRQVIELDSTLDGWPWTPGAFAWVEPTAWALLALKAAWPERAPRNVRNRVREGESMLLDRACPGGGWNYGNSRVLDVDLKPFADTTALALLGLRGRDAPAVREGFDALGRLLDDEHASSLSLALAALAYRAWRRDPAPVQRRLVERIAAGRFPEDTRTHALSLLALARRLPWLGGDHA